MAIDSRKPADSLKQTEGELQASLHAFRGLLHQPVPRLATVPALQRAAAELCTAASGIAAIRATIQLAIDHLGDDRKEVAELLFGLTCASHGKRVGERRHLAATKYRELADKSEAEYSDEKFRTKAERALVADLARVLAALLEEPRQPVTHSTATTPEPEATPSHSDRLPVGDSKTEPTPTPKWRSARPLPMLILIAAVLIVGVVIWVSEESQPGSVQAQLSRLSSEAERNLTGTQAPEPGDASRRLGFGDPTTGGRKAYYLAEWLKSAPTNPTLDSLIFAVRNVFVYDARRFLSVQVSSLHDARQLLRSTAHAASAPAREVVWLTALVANNVKANPNCARNEYGIVTNVHLLLSIWNSPNGRLHIIRAWLTAADTDPKWITDAVAVLTDTSVTLEPDSSISRELAINLNPETPDPNIFAIEPPIDVESILTAPGLVIGEEGVVGTCENNSSYFVQIGFRQTPAS